ncbi:hypothetical protein VHEMI02266 [[Torrubiella] hemipterigena]|uniref:F-box domain-containing protein n=1 Tax=[Torrubiella] hemipterigena TaxID=1531966 RepID=A0A0A1TA18_9HYPO|nr:hypothetical protein VHEMI02266 [[Torrubiella] hemipterigena]
MAAIERLPWDILSAITSRLEQQDFHSLRCSSRTLSRGVVTPTFEDSFTTKTVAFTPSGLERLANVTEKGELACKIQNLTLSGPSFLGYHACGRRRVVEELASSKQQTVAEYNLARDSGKLTKLLTKAFENIAKKNPASRLEQLCVSSFDYDTYLRYGRNVSVATCDRKDAAADVYNAILCAIAASGIAVRHLSPMSCRSLWKQTPVDSQMQEVFSDFYGASEAFQYLESLELPTISMSEERLDITADGEQYTTPLQQGPRQTASLRRPPPLLDELTFHASTLLDLAQNITSLSIGANRALTDVRPSGEMDYTSEIVIHYLSTARLPHLTTCQLYLLRVYEDDLVLLLRRNTLKTLRLHGIDVVHGELRPVLDECAEPFFMLETLHLKYISVRRRTVEFEPMPNHTTDTATITANKGQSKVEEVTLSREQLRGGVRFSLREARKLPESELFRLLRVD